jgi:hypothetical protein
MKKSDLKMGMVVELRDNTLMMVVNDMLVDVECNLELSGYGEDLLYYCECEYDIMAVYAVTHTSFIFGNLQNHNYRCLDLIWKREEKIEFSRFEKEVLKNITEFNYITRDKGNNLELFVLEPKFSMNKDYWINTNSCESFNALRHMFQEIKPMTCYKISDLLED